MPGFLASGGEMGALIGAQDWSGSALGTPEGWPSALKSTLATTLSSSLPMFVAWGPELLYFFNDAYRPRMGARSGGAVGLPATRPAIKASDANFSR